MVVCDICFSPTGGTKKATSIMAASLGEKSEFIDLTDSRADLFWSVLILSTFCPQAQSGHADRGWHRAEEDVFRLEGK